MDFFYNNYDSADQRFLPDVSLTHATQIWNVLRGWFKLETAVTLANSRIVIVFIEC